MSKPKDLVAQPERMSWLVLGSVGQVVDTCLD